VFTAVVTQKSVNNDKLLSLANFSISQVISWSLTREWQLVKLNGGLTLGLFVTGSVILVKLWLNSALTLVYL